MIINLIMGKKWVSWHARGDVMITHKGLKGLWKKLGGEINGNVWNLWL